MSARFEGVNAVGMPHCVFVPGEEYGLDTLGPDQWGVSLGDPNATALVIVGKRDDVLAAIDRARDELLSYYTAEHVNGYHLRAPERNCPECCPEEMACPECSNTRANGWLGIGEGDRVGCGECFHVWEPFGSAA
jgi:hypothetical protein